MIGLKIKLGTQGALIGQYIETGLTLESCLKLQLMMITLDQIDSLADDLNSTNMYSHERPYFIQTVSGDKPPPPCGLRSKISYAANP